MGRNRRRGRCNDNRLRLGGLGNGRNSRKNGGDQRRGCFSPSTYATLRCKGGAATGTACALEEGERLESWRLCHQGPLCRRKGVRIDTRGSHGCEAACYLIAGRGPRDHAKSHAENKTLHCQDRAG